MRKQVKRVRRCLLCFCFLGLGILWLLLPTTLYATSQIDVTDLEKGVVHVGYTSTSGKRLKVMIQQGDKKYTYNLDEKGKLESFPLQLGNGQYKISIMENTTGTKYRLVTSKTVTLKMSNPNDVYLNAIQNINWSTDSKAIQYAKTLVTTSTSANDKISTYYKNVVANYSYDYDKLATLTTLYVPDIDSTFKDKTGICYDFSSLYASMLRSQGVPVKLVKGYTPNAVGYHAWNEAWNAATGEWMIIDSTYDLQVILKKKDVKMVKASSEYEKVNEY